jgi:protein required for attachment to host cells
MSRGPSRRLVNCFTRKPGGPFGRVHAAALSARRSRSLAQGLSCRLLDVLARRLEQNSYDRRSIVARPVTLGDLRAEIPDQVRANVVGGVAHDLAKFPNGEVAEHLKSVLITLSDRLRLPILR